MALAVQHTMSRNVSVEAIKAGKQLERKESLSMVAQVPQCENPWHVEQHESQAALADSR